MLSGQGFKPAVGRMLREEALDGCGHLAISYFAQLGGAS